MAEVTLPRRTRLPYSNIGAAMTDFFAHEEKTPSDRTGMSYSDAQLAMPKVKCQRRRKGTLGDQLTFNIPPFHPKTGIQNGSKAR